MDIAYYISDLLGQQGELSVPNLGYFVQIRMSAYYDEKAKKFFPPHYAVKFDPQVIDDDDTLAAYITGLKKISLASAKYFIEKYISNLKSQVIIEDVPFANLGSFSSDGIKLTFHAGTKTDDPGFFAYAPVEAYKIGQTHDAKPPLTTAPPVEITAPSTVQPEAETYITPPVTPVTPVEESINTVTPDEYTYEDEPRRSMSIWIILLIIVTILAIAFVAVYKLRPDLLKGILPEQKNTSITETKPTATPAPIKSIDTIGAKTPVFTDTTKKDTVKTATGTPANTHKTDVSTTAASTVANNTTATPAVTKAPVTKVPAATMVPVNTAATEDTIAKGSWVIYNGAFPTRSGAEGRIDYDKSKGFTQARLLKKKVGPGGNYKVILGAFKTRAEAQSASQDLLVTGKIKKTELSVELYK